MGGGLPHFGNLLSTPAHLMRQFRKLYFVQRTVGITLDTTLIADSHQWLHILLHLICRNLTSFILISNLSAQIIWETVYACQVSRCLMQSIDYLDLIVRVRIINMNLWRFSVLHLIWYMFKNYRFLLSVKSFNYICVKIYYHINKFSLRRGAL